VIIRHRLRQSVTNAEPEYTNRKNSPALALRSLGGIIQERGAGARGKLRPFGPSTVSVKRGRGGAKKIMGGARVEGFWRVPISFLECGGDGRS